MPVLPDVASSRILSRVSAPERSPSAIIRAAGRSFTEPPGFFHSAFAYSSTLRRPFSKSDRRISGVFPIRSMTEAAVRGSPGVATDISDWSSPRLYRNITPTLMGRLSGVNAAAAQPERAGSKADLQVGLLLFRRPPFGVPDLDRAEIQLLQLGLDCLAVADGHDGHPPGHEVLFRHGQRLVPRDRLHLFGVIGVVVDAEV